MGPTLKYLAIALAATFAVTSCAQSDYATINISYPNQAPGAGDQWPRADSSLRQKISKSFGQVAEANGYKCRAHVKRVEEITCRGPKDMHVTFKPTLNSPEFVATFNWIELGDRTPDEFKGHIEKFSAAMTNAVNDKTVRLAVIQSAPRDADVHASTAVGSTTE